MAKGFGSALPSNFDPHWGLEFDLGHNWGDGNYETTASAGPRLMFRTEGANYFLHALGGYNRRAVRGVKTHTGGGAVLCGGSDPRLTNRMTPPLLVATI